MDSNVIVECGDFLEFQVLSLIVILIILRLFVGYECHPGGS